MSIFCNKCFTGRLRRRVSGRCRGQFLKSLTEGAKRSELMRGRKYNHLAGLEESGSFLVAIMLVACSSGDVENDVNERGLDRFTERVEFEN
jgi:hypothetical protein